MNVSEVPGFVEERFEGWVETLADLVRIPSVSFPGFPEAEVRRSAETIAELFRQAGMSDVRLLELDGAHPAVYGSIEGPPGAPTVLLYAHHDVQPPGPAEEWDSAPFEPHIVDGRMLGRGASDDKSGVIMHLATVQALASDPPVGIKVIIEGEEELGSVHLSEFLGAYEDLLRADVIVIGDAGNWREGVPALTTSLRGLSSATVEVRTAASAAHSGLFGGSFPDALMVLTRLLATLHDDQGAVAVAGLVSEDPPGPDLSDDEVAAQLKAVTGLEPIGRGAVTSRLWFQPAVTVTAIDAPPTSQSINQLVPIARAAISMRIPPGQDPVEAANALRLHLEANVPWGAELTFIPGGSADAHRLEADGPAATLWKEAMKDVWEVEPVEMGVGGTIPFVADFSHRFPDAEILLTGAGNPESLIHAPNENQHLGDLRHSIAAQLSAIIRLADA